MPSGKPKLKQDTIPRIRMTKFRIMITPNAGKDAKQQELSFPADGNAK